MSHETTLSVAQPPSDDDGPAVFRAVGALQALAADISAATTSREALAALTRHSARVVEGADAAGITIVDRDGFETVGATERLAEEVDAIQYALRSGPCVDAAIEERVLLAEDLRVDSRWPEFGRRTVEQTGVLSMLAFRLYFEDEPDVGAALNLYSRSPAAFTEAAQLAGLAACVYGAALITSDRRRIQVLNLERALESSREIGAAVGILMTRHRVTREQAFDLLRMASQSSQRKLADIAGDVVETGSLDMG